MSESPETSFILPENTKQKWTSLTSEERKSIFSDVYRETLNEPAMGEAIIDIQSDKYADAPLEACYFPDYPDFQKNLSAATEAYSSEEK